MGGSRSTRPSLQSWSSVRSSSRSRPTRNSERVSWGEAQERVDGRRRERARQRRENGARQVVFRGVAVRRRHPGDAEVAETERLLDALVVDDDDDARGAMHRRRQGRRGDGRRRRATPSRRQANRRQAPAAGVAGAHGFSRVCGHERAEGKAAALLSGAPHDFHLGSRESRPPGAPGRSLGHERAFAREV